MKYDVVCSKCSTGFVVEKNPSCPKKKPKLLLALCPTCNVTRKTMVSTPNENARALSKLLYICAMIYFAYTLLEMTVLKTLNKTDMILLFVLVMGGYITSR